MELTSFYQKFVDDELANGNTDPVKIAEKLIKTHGCGVPNYLFMSVYTVCEHIEHSKVNK